MGEKKLRVVQLNKLYYPEIGGIEVVAQQLAEGLRDRTDASVLVCSRSKKTQTDMVNGVPVVRSGSIGMLGSMPLSFSYLRDVKKAAANADVLQLHMPFPLGDLAILLSGYQGKVAVWWHSDIVRQKKLMLLYKPIMKRMLKRADSIIVSTQGLLDGSSYLGQYREKCHIIPFGISDERLDACKVTAAEHRAADGPVKLLFTGRLVYYKGCEVLLLAFAKVRTDCVLTMIGDGPLAERLHSLAQEYGVSDRVRFLGRASDDALYREMADCDVFILPSIAKSEAFGLVQIEAMAFGKPVINTNLKSGVPCVSLDGQTGFTVEPGDAQALAEAIDKLAGDAELRIRYGKAARARVESTFRLSTMLDGVLAEYKRLCAGKEEA